MVTDCLFCKIVKGDIPTKRLFENEHVIAFADINPQAPTHLLLIPKKHISSLADIGEEDGAILASIQLAARDLAAEHELSEGFRLVTNCGKLAGQTVQHLHYHLIGGRELGWPPG